MRQSSTTSEYVTRARVYPDGGFVVYRGRNGQEKKGQERVIDRRAYAGLPSVQAEIPGATSRELAAVVGSRMSSLSESERGGARLDGAAPLDLTERTNSRDSQKPRLPRGLNGMTSYARRLVTNCVAYMEERYGKDQLTFLTLTLPRVTDEELAAIQDNWADILHRTTELLSEALKRKGLPGEIVGAVEIQPQRFERTGQEVPHLHLVFVGRHRKKTWALTPKMIRNIWSKQCQKRIERQLNWNAAVDVRRVVKSAGRYLAKYLSKGSTTGTSDPCTGEVKSFVASWYVASLSLRRRFKKSINVLGNSAQVLELLIKESPESVQVYHKYICLSDGTNLWVAMTGVLPYSWHSWFCIPMSSHSDSLFR